MRYTVSLSKYYMHRNPFPVYASGEIPICNLLHHFHFPHLCSYYSLIIYFSVIMHLLRYTSQLHDSLINIIFSLTAKYVSLCIQHIMCFSFL